MCTDDEISSSFCFKSNKFGCKKIKKIRQNHTVDLLANGQNHRKITAFKYHIYCLQSHCLNAPWL